MIILGVGSVELQSSLFSSRIWSVWEEYLLIILYSHVFIIIQYYDNAFQKLYFLMQFLPICYRIHRSSYLKYGGPDPAGPRAPKSGGSTDPVVPTPLQIGLITEYCYNEDLFFHSWVSQKG